MAIWRGLKSFGARDFSPENITVGGTKVPRSDQKHPPDKLQFGEAIFGTHVVFYAMRGLSFLSSPLSGQEKPPQKPVRASAGADVR